MLTFKQLEAVFWVVRLGGFAQAAHQLHTTQSAISKRIREIEELFGTALFDRTLRAARLTDKGEEMFLLAKALLEHRDVALEQFQSAQTLQRQVRIGVTELTAMTWLPRLVSAIQTRYPRVVIAPQVDASAMLRDKLLADEVDLAIMPQVFDDQRFVARPVGSAEHVWMCKPGLLGRARRLQAHELAGQRLLTQDNRSGTGLLYSRWLRSVGVQPQETLVSSSVVALIGLTVSGMGVSYLPRQCLAPMIASGKLQALNVSPALPRTRYVAVCKADRPSALVTDIAELAQAHCDFGEIFQAG